MLIKKEAFQSWCSETLKVGADFILAQQCSWKSVKTVLLSLEFSAIISRLQLIVSCDQFTFIQISKLVKSGVRKRSFSFSPGAAFWRESMSRLTAFPRSFFLCKEILRFLVRIWACRGNKLSSYACSPSQESRAKSGYLGKTRNGETAVACVSN